MARSMELENMGNFLSADEVVLPAHSIENDSQYQVGAACSKDADAIGLGKDRILYLRLFCIELLL